MPSERGDEQASAQDRIEWLLEHRYEGSRTAMAKATGVSMSGLIKVVTRQQTPGRRLMETIIRNTDVSPAWLLAGEGQPFKATAMPAVTACPDGMPDGRDPGLTAGVPELGDLYSPSRYWLKLRAAEPAIKAGVTKLAVGDFLLMETDRTKFPPPEGLSGRWGVVRVRVLGGVALRLAELTHSRESSEEPACLDAETYVQYPMQVHQTVIEEFPNGDVEVHKRILQLEQPKGEGVNKGDRKRYAASIVGHYVKVSDVAAVCVLLVRPFQPAA